MPGEVVGVNGKAKINKTLEEPDDWRNKNNDPHARTPEVLCYLLKAIPARGGHGNSPRQVIWMLLLISLEQKYK